MGLRTLCCIGVRCRDSAWDILPNSLPKERILFSRNYCERRPSLTPVGLLFSGYSCGVKRYAKLRLPEPYSLRIFALYVKKQIKGTPPEL